MNHFLSRVTRVLSTTAVVVSAVVCVSSSSVYAEGRASVAAAGDGLRAADAGSCTGIDASTSSWSWTKPTLEFSTDSGATYQSASGTQWQTSVCRDTARYWFIIRTSTAADMGSAGLASGLQFKVTVPAKAGDTYMSAQGYSDMVSYSETSGAAVIVTKAASIAKLNFDSQQAVLARHPECKGVLEQCSFEKADVDYVATVIQHIDYSTAALNEQQLWQKGLWVGASVNGFSISMNCSSPPSGSSGSTYSDPSGSPPSGSSGSSSSPELKVSITNTPHLKFSGEVNSGSLKTFFTKDVATKCFGDGKSTTTLAQIAEKMSVQRSETKEGTTTPVFKAEAVSVPVEGIVVSVPNMTFSNPIYSVKNTLAAQSLAVYTQNNNSSSSPSSSPSSSSSGSSSGSTSDSSSSTPVLKNYVRTTVNVTKATITVVLVTGQKITIYRKVNGKLTLLKSMTGKKGSNKFITVFNKGYSFVVKDSKGKVISTQITSTSLRHFV
ncbi:MAG: hypothetical protein NTZ62_01215 [Actinobacteria bacterium]|nr:hypothetical protein [Actinomycetota bacterium]